MAELPHAAMLDATVQVRLVERISGGPPRERGHMVEMLQDVEDRVTNMAPVYYGLWIFYNS